MGEVGTCPKCGGEQREGELFVSAMQRASTVPMMMGGDDIGSMLRMYRGGDVSVEGPFWREYTGKETGWPFKRRETQVFRVKGKRCMSCGYIELFISSPTVTD